MQRGGLVIANRPPAHGRFYYLVTMGKLLQLIDKFQRLDVDQVANESMTEITPDIEQAQREQFLKGEASDGSIIGRYKSSAYARMKNQLNPVAGLGIVDLTLHKDFSRNVNAAIESGKLFLNSIDPKAEWLGKRYGDDRISGLNAESKVPLVRNKLRPAMMRNIRKTIRL
jgi:hypothetical protein